MHVRGLLGSLEVEATYLAQVSAATFYHPDSKVTHFVKCARGVHANFFVASRHGVYLVFCRLGQHNLLFVPRACF